ncbi:hypothetical protein AWB80_08397 [Caballeronia pedi]|uniref:Uncharacterized protein n=1 Tax=Caballeronia pedi TaxID=1777141 RepID=A0A158E6U5_9BURK|nr:hypothetical protein [Caballeronia pedi]SAL02602.1 hypothetical protein AWB80_08397 [Caballeronia pedi]
MFEKILKGESPAKVFRELIEADPSIGKIQLGELFNDEFVDLTGEAQQLIWHWKGPGKSQGLDDADLDALLRQQLRNAGYL